MLKAWAEVWFILAEGRRTLGFLRIYGPRRRTVCPPWCGFAGIERWRSVYDSAAQYVIGELWGIPIAASSPDWSHCGADRGRVNSPDRPPEERLHPFGRTAPGYALSHAVRADALCQRRTDEWVVVGLCTSPREISSVSPHWLSPMRCRYRPRSRTSPYRSAQ